jgi:hypothetical protein
MADISDRSLDVSIHNPSDVTKAVTTTTDGAKERLDVDASISSDDSPTKYELGTYYNASGVTVTSAADVELLGYTGAGVLDFIAAVAGSSGYEIAIYTDGVERLRINMNDLGSNLGLANATNVPLWVETANKNFRWHPPTQVGFKTSFSIKARATGANVTISSLILYRKKT